MAGLSKVTEKDGQIWKLLADPDFKVTREGDIFTCRPANQRLDDGTYKRSSGWRRAGWISGSRFNTKLYMRIEYKGVQLYGHRIIFAAFAGELDPFKIVNHKDMDGLHNNFDNLEQITPSQNIAHAYRLIKGSGLSAAEIRELTRKVAT